MGKAAVLTAGIEPWIESILNSLQSLGWEITVYCEQPDTSTSSFSIFQPVQNGLSLQSFLSVVQAQADVCFIFLGEKKAHWRFQTLRALLAQLPIPKICFFSRAPKWSETWLLQQANLSVATTHELLVKAHQKKWVTKGNGDVLGIDSASKISDEVVNLLSRKIRSACAQ